MADEEEINEWEEIQERRHSKGITNFINQISNWQFFIILALGGVFFYLINSEYKNTAWILGISVIALLFFFAKKSESTKLISEDNAKRIAIRALENKKERGEIPPDADISPTNFCKLRWRMAQPHEWHVGMKIETNSGKIEYWRVDIHPYDGIVTGIVRTQFEGDEKPDVLVVEPQHYVKGA